MTEIMINISFIKKIENKDVICIKLTIIIFMKLCSTKNNNFIFIILSDYEVSVYRSCEHIEVSRNIIICKS
jgi:hypothetical protein